MHDPPWWDEAYAYRAPLALFPLAPQVSAGTLVRVALDHSALVAAGKSTADGDDLRVVA